MEAITSSLIEIIGSILGIALVIVLKAAFDALKGVERSKGAEALNKHFPVIHEAVKDLLHEALAGGAVELNELMVGEKYEGLRDRALEKANTLARRAGIKQDVHEDLIDGILARAAEEVGRARSLN